MCTFTSARNTVTGVKGPRYRLRLGDVFLDSGLGLRQGGLEKLIQMQVLLIYAL